MVLLVWLGWWDGVVSVVGVVGWCCWCGWGGGMVLLVWLGWWDVVVINGGNGVAGMIRLSKIRWCGNDCQRANSLSLTCCVLRVMWRRCRLLVALLRVPCSVLRVMY